MESLEIQIFDLYQKQELLTKTSNKLQTLRAFPVKLPSNATEYNSRQLDNVIKFKKEEMELTTEITKLTATIEALQKKLLDYFIEAELPVGIPVFSTVGREQYRTNYYNDGTITTAKI